MVDVVLFHAIMGLRAAEHAWADRMRATGHRVFTPDLFAGETAATIEAGFELEKRIGWDTIVARAADASADLPNDAVLAGISMGAGVAGGLWARRPATRGVLLLHGVCEVPADARRGLPAQVPPRRARSLRIRGMGRGLAIRRRRGEPRRRDLPLPRRRPLFHRPLAPRLRPGRRPADLRAGDRLSRQALSAAGRELP